MEDLILAVLEVRKYIISIDQIENIFIAVDGDSKTVVYWGRNHSIDLVSYLRSIQLSENIVSILQLALNYDKTNSKSCGFILCRFDIHQV